VVKRVVSMVRSRARAELRPETAAIAKPILLEGDAPAMTAASGSDDAPVTTQAGCFAANDVSCSAFASPAALDAMCAMPDTLKRRKVWAVAPSGVAIPIAGPPEKFFLQQGIELRPLLRSALGKRNSERVCDSQHKPSQGRWRLALKEAELHDPRLAVPSAAENGSVRVYVRLAGSRLYRMLRLDCSWTARQALSFLCEELGVREPERLECVRVQTLTESAQARCGVGRWRLCAWPTQWRLLQRTCERRLVDGRACDAYTCEGGRLELLLKAEDDAPPG